MTVEKRLENALSISESIKNGKISPNKLYDLQLHLSDALNQVKELSNTKWFSVKNIRPTGRVIAIGKQNEIIIGFISKRNGCFFCENAETLLESVTHWMGLPEPPI